MQCFVLVRYLWKKYTDISNKKVLYDMNTSFTSLDIWKQPQLSSTNQTLSRFEKILFYNIFLILDWFFKYDYLTMNISNITEEPFYLESLYGILNVRVSIYVYYLSMKSSWATGSKQKIVSLKVFMSIHKYTFKSIWQINFRWS